MEILGVNPEIISEVLSNYYKVEVEITQAIFEKGTEYFGGANGEKALVRLENDILSPIPRRLFLKRVPPDLTGEADIYLLLHSLNAPITPMYGYTDQEDGRRTIILKYLTEAPLWPIPMDYHLAWVSSAAKWASIKVPEKVEFPMIEWKKSEVRYEKDIETILGFEDDLVQGEIDKRELREIIELSSENLGEILEYADTIPTSLYHGQLYSYHTGKNPETDEVLFFDLAGLRKAPRFMDFVAVIIDHGEPYETSIDLLMNHFHSSYVELTGKNLQIADFNKEVRFCRGLVALDRLKLTYYWAKSMLDQFPEKNVGINNSCRKWVILHLEALRSLLLNRKSLMN